MKNLKSIVFIAIIVIIISNIGCKKDHGTPPAVPPQTTFKMSFSDFDSTKVSQKKDTTYTNYIYAAENVIFWNTVLTLNLAIPVYAFTEASKYQAVWSTSDNKWVWTYTFGTIYNAKLKAQVSGSDVNWEMYISQNGGFQNVKWYTGTSKVDGSQGAWTLNKDAYNVTPYIGIEWHQNKTAGTYDIKYTNIIPNDPGNGSFIQYGLTTSGLYNAYYTIFGNTTPSRTINIEWNTSTKEGHIKDSGVHFAWKSNGWHCWDNYLKNVTCQ